MIDMIHMIASPDMSFSLLVLGIYGLFFEMVMPGILLPGITGAICLVIGLIGFSMLPINYNGAWLFLIGFAFIIGEVILPTFGVFAIIGTLVFASGGYVIIDKSVYGSGISLWLIALIAGISLAMIFYVSNIYIKSRKAKITTGSEGLKGSEGTVVSWAGYHGEVSTSGATWKAKSLSGTHFKPSDKIIVKDIEGLTLIIEPYNLKETK